MGDELICSLIMFSTKYRYHPLPVDVDGTLTAMEASCGVLVTLQTTMKKQNVKIHRCFHDTSHIAFMPQGLNTNIARARL